jgi:transcriptional regulator with XRE-family HTH domain
MGKRQQRQDDPRAERAFGAVLRSLRVARGWSQEELGFHSGYDRTYISMLERGKKSPSLRTIVRLAASLGTRPSLILRRIEAKLR